MRKLSTERKLALAFSVALVTISGLAFTLYQSARELFQSNQLVANTLELMMAVGNTFSRLTEAETAQRGFILTGDRSFLNHYPASVGAVNRELLKLRALTSDNPKQRATLERLDPMIQQRIERMEESILIRESHGFKPALEMILSKKGTELMRQIREVIVEMQTEEETTLDRRYQRLARNSRRTLRGFLVITCLNFGLLSLAFVVVRRDLAERARNLENQTRLVRNLEAANQQLRDFAHVVSHDLKAPLRGINSLAAFLAMDYAAQLDDEGRSILSLLTQRVQRMHDLIEGILQYSQLTHGARPQTPIDLNPFVHEIWELLSPPPAAKLILPHPLPTVVYNKLLLQQIFQNLLGNALKHHDKPEPRVTVSCKEQPKEWIFSVADNGPGIDPKYFSKIFQLFQTLRPRDDKESTGIGLAVVKRAVEISSGKVWVESEPGKGSAFFFSLPKMPPVF